MHLREDIAIYKILLSFKVCSTFLNFKLKLPPTLSLILRAVTFFVGGY